MPAYPISRNDIAARRERPDIDEGVVLGHFYGYKPVVFYWGLSELMERYVIKGKDLANLLGRRASTISKWRNIDGDPRLSVDDLSKLFNALVELANPIHVQSFGPIYPVDLIRYGDPDDA